MKDGMRFVDPDMHIQEPADLLDKYLDPKFKDRVTVMVDKKGQTVRGGWIIDGRPISAETELVKYRKPNAPLPEISGPTGDVDAPFQSASRIASSGRMHFAIERDYDPEAQIMAFEMEGVDIAVLYPTVGLGMLSPNDMDPHLSLALCQAYNNWIYEFCRYSPDQMKFAAMLPPHDVNLACQELVRCVNELGAVASFLRPNLVCGHFWHSNYWDPLYTLHEELDVTWGFHEGTGAWNSHMNALYGENLFFRHVASHPIEMMQAMIAQIIGGVFEFHPRLRVGYLEAQSWWAPGLLSRIEADAGNYRDTHAPYLSLTPTEYFHRNCWVAVEGTEPEIGPTVKLIGPDRICISTDYPHFDSHFPEVTNNLIKNVGREIAAGILYGGAGLFNFGEHDFQKADAAAAANNFTAGHFAKSDTPR